jgi:hypothetical protein
MIRSTPTALVLAAATASLVACGSGTSDGLPSLPSGPNQTAQPGPTSSSSSGSSSGGATGSSSGSGSGSGGAPASAATAMWATHLGGPQADLGQGVASDSNGETVVVGTFQGTATIGGVPLTSAGEIDFFVARYATDGTIEWIRPFGGPGNDAVTSVAIDKSGGVYVAGDSDGQLTLGGSSFGQTSATGAFLLMLDRYGNVTNAKAYGGGAYGTTVGVAVASDGSIGLCGSYVGQIDLGGGPLTAAQGTYAGFIAKLDATATYVYANPLGTSATATAQGLSFDAAGDVAVVGTFTGTGQFGSATLNSAGDSDVFVSTFDPTGNPLQSKSFGGPGQDDGHAVTFDAKGDLIVAGDFSDTVDFGSGPVMSQGSLDAFVFETTPVGSVAWAKQFGGPSVDQASALAVDSSGDVLVSGEFEQTMTLGTTPFTSAGDKDIFVAQFSATGDFSWAKRMGGLQADEGYGVAFDSSGNALVTGYFRENVDFGTGMQTSAGDDDVFVAAYAP